MIRELLISALPTDDGVARRMRRAVCERPRPERALLLVDVRRSLVSSRTSSAAACAIAVARRSRLEGYAPVVASVRGERGDEARILPLDLADDVDAVLFRDQVSAATRELVARLDDHGVRAVDVCGLGTETGVVATALALHDAGFRVRVLANACASTESRKAHWATLSVLSSVLGKDCVVRYA